MSKDKRTDVFELSERVRELEQRLAEMEAEHQRVEERQSYQAMLLENVHDAIIAMDENFLITSWNRAAEELYGWKAEEVLGRRAIEVTRTQITEDQRQEILEIEARGGSYRIDLLHYRKDGTPVYVETTSLALFDADRQLTGYVTASRDVTERKKMETLLQSRNLALEASAEALRNAKDELELRVQERTQELRASQEQLQAVVNSAPVILWAMDREGKVTLLEGKALSSIGLSPGKRGAEEFKQRLSKRPELKDPIQRAQAGQEVGGLILVSQNGKEVFEAHYAPYYDLNGQLAGVIGVSIQITARVRAEEALRKANEELEQSNLDLETRVAERTAQLGNAIRRLGQAYERLTRANKQLEQAKLDLEWELAERERAEAALEAYALQLERTNRDLQDFASIASHDLQEPLRKIQAFGDRLMGAKVADKLIGQERDYLERMVRSAARMSDMIRDLLAYSRLSTQAQPVTLVDLQSLAREVLTDLKIAIERSHGKVELGELPTIEVDPLQMRLLLQNLISNSLKFHKPEVPPRVKVYSMAAGDKGSGEGIEIIVEDNGIGFEEKYAEHLFQPFLRLVGRGEYEGSGMGLAICRKIVERHQGSITASGSPGEGARFVVRLPFRQDSNRALSKEEGLR